MLKPARASSSVRGPRCLQSRPRTLEDSRAGLESRPCPAPMNEPKVAGLIPWLPWPVCRWRAWTDLVRAERLAALRIGLAFVMLVDILTTYGPHVTDFYGPDSLARVGDTDLFGSTIQAGQLRGQTNRPESYWYWSLWRGFGHPVNLGFFLAGWLVLTAWLACRLIDRGRPGGEPPFVSWELLIGSWVTFATLAVIGFGARLETLPEEVDPGPGLRFYAALVPVAVACAFLLLKQLFRPALPAAEEEKRLDRLLVAAWALSVVLLLVGLWQW